MTVSQTDPQGCKPEPEKPTIVQRQVVAKSRFFQIESLDLKFTNGAERQYERMVSRMHGAVMTVPIDNQELLLVREYCAGTHSYTLGFPKGLIDPGESPEQAANRELKEEAGFGAKQLTKLKVLELAPAYFANAMTIFVAQDLYPEQLAGDEPEPLELIRWPLAQANELLQQDDFTEARSVAALLLALNWLPQSGSL
ncbi:ADP compounds hydrolase NudE [Motilimonas pumila]|uniref:ADP compounds hydrolase NudE n=1 Tax=Motilimonas pumila TaxID=2303987 RepID=A0A418YLC9_9GAMM|nr:ADP compounds hydrolase NudE [Motilimonas pumila]RJG51610.1 ADP compounds hydrolase NudE [Motilimonas pumila]